MVIGNVTCGGAECLLSYGEYCRHEAVTGQSHCHCPSCPAVLRPTCGSDGRTYGSECEAQRQSCLSRRHISVLYVARCGSYYHSWTRCITQPLIAHLSCALLCCELESFHTISVYYQRFWFVLDYGALQIYLLTYLLTITYLLILAVLCCRSSGRRSRERPKKHWVDFVEEDLYRAGTSRYHFITGRRWVSLQDRRNQWRKLMAASMAETSFVMTRRTWPDLYTYIVG